MHPPLVPLHRGFDGFIGGMARSSGLTSSSLLRATPGVRVMTPARSRVSTITGGRLVGLPGSVASADLTSNCRCKQLIQRAS